MEAEEAPPHPPDDSKIENANFYRNDPVLPDVEVILFYGPPFCGKTRYYNEHYAGTHVRCCARDVFSSLSSDCNSKGLHAVVKHVLSLVQSGLNVVVDDEHQRSDTRRSFTQLLKAKVPHVKLTAIKFWPSGGPMQCYWAREFACCERGGVGDMASVEHIRQWFSGMQHPPRKVDGFSFVFSVRTRLYANWEDDSQPSSNSVVECLILDCSSLIEYEGGTAQGCRMRHAPQAMGRAVKEWVSECRRQGHKGVVAVVGAEGHVFPASLEALEQLDPCLMLEEVENCREALKRVLSKFSLDCGAQLALNDDQNEHSHQQRSVLDCADIPIVRVMCEYTARPEECWWIPPSGFGLFACIQRLFRVNFSHSTVVAAEGSPLWNCAVQMGIARISCARMFASKEVMGWDTATRIRRFGASGGEGSQELRFALGEINGHKDGRLSILDCGRFVDCSWEVLGRHVGGEAFEPREEESSMRETERRRRVLPSWLEEEARQEEEDDDEVQEVVKKTRHV